MELSNDQIDVLIFLAYIGGTIAIGAVFGVLLAGGKILHEGQALRARRRRERLSSRRHHPSTDYPNRHPNGGWQPVGPGPDPLPKPPAGMRSAVTRINPVRLPR